MSRHDVYEGEMPKRVLTDRQIEILLSGQTPGEENLARFGNVLVRLHGPVPMPPDNERILAFAVEAGRVSLDSRDEHHNGESASRTIRNPILGLKRRMAGGLAAAVLLSGMTGVAVAANGSGPGDALYGLDRALEAVGIGDGGAAERIAEARRLLDEGELSTAIGQMADAVAAQEEDFSPEAAKASDALRGAADSVRSAQADPDSEDVRGAVAAMLSEIALLLETEEFDGAALGARIAEMARALGEANGQDRSPGPPENAGPSSPGQAGNAGQEKGSSGDNRGGTPSGTPSGSPDGAPGGSPNRP